MLTIDLRQIVRSFDSVEITAIKKCLLKGGKCVRLRHRIERAVRGKSTAITIADYAVLLNRLEQNGRKLAMGMALRVDGILRQLEPDVYSTDTQFWFNFNSMELNEYSEELCAICGGDFDPVMCCCRVCGDVV